MMRRTMKITHQTDPWEHIIVEDLLSAERFAEIKKIGMIEYENYLKNGHNSLYTDHKDDPRYTSRAKYTKYFADDIIPETNQFFKMLPHHRGFKGELKKLIHITINPPDFNYPLHIDNISRINTCIFYIYPDESIGTILANNPSCNDDGDHSAANKKSHWEQEVPWKPNTLFVHNSIPNKTWHKYIGDKKNYRMTLCCFLVQPDLVKHGKGRIPTTYVDIDPKFYR